MESNACNSNNVTMSNLTDYESIVLIDIGDDNLMYVNRFVIDELNHLNTLKIGMNSFGSYDEESIFQILNCNELESIEIGIYSFSDYGGLFELKNLPKLSTIKLGEIGRYSWNFCFSSFEIKGIIDMILLMNRSSTFEFHYIRKKCISRISINNDIKYLNDLNE